MYKVIGIDEAGKGPVLGSLFIGFSIINLANGVKDLNEYQNKLKKLGVMDSKKLSPKKRNYIYNSLKEMMDMKYAQLTPIIIDENKQNGRDLMQLEIAAIAKVLNDEQPQCIIIDALMKDTEKFTTILEKTLNFECTIIAENKADSTYPIVGAASVIAKELREQEIAQIHQNVEEDVGSGYPGDEKTRQFVKQNGKNKELRFLFRTSWKTYQELCSNSLLNY
ncbi:MAG: ribonuclease HII [Candidatus Nanoarchaeia archaeon]